MGCRCNPIGFKIGLELMVRCKASPVVDVPITFQERTAGESKLTMKQNVSHYGIWLFVTYSLCTLMILESFM